jgi:hypothetical protein
MKNFKKLLSAMIVCITLTAQAQVNINNNLVKIDASGDLIYNFRHTVGSADSLVGYNVGALANVYYKLAPTFTTREADGITMAADSVTLLVSGDYEIHCWLQLTTSAATDKLRIKIYKNGAPMSPSLGRWIINSDGSGVQTETKYYMWYIIGGTAGDRYSVRAANLTGARAITCTDLKLYVKRVPE